MSEFPEQAATELERVDIPLHSSREVTPFSADLAEMDLNSALAKVERRITFVKQAKTLALKITDPADWKNMAGTPYLQASGCRKLKPVFRIRYLSWHIEPSLAEAVRSMRNNEPVSFLVSGIARCEATGEESCFIGGRSSDDDFFTTKYVSGKKQDKPMTEIDVLDVMKGAFTNWEHRAVCGLLGLDNLSWDDLLPHGIKPSGTVDYKTRQKEQPPKASADAGANNKPQQTKSNLTVEEMLNTIRGKLEREEPNPSKALQLLTKGRFSLLTDLNKASEEQIHWLFDKLFPPE